MKPFKTMTLLLLAGGLLLSPSAFASPQARTCQVTGPVLELTDTVIVVQKGDERWELARDKGTKITGELKVGTKVTVHYRCVAVDVEVKAAKSEPKSK